ncbi:response regulator [Dactylosporangium sp. NPDC000521]|uniref:response regulator n=1 Tax=Dactylosporangium sp. NPDC000521 TaxID=3363975 RepID=UPI00369BDF1A
METTATVGYRLLFRHAPAALLVLDPHLTIVEASDAYLAATMCTRDGLIGRGVFEAFPVNPDDPESSGIAALDASLRRVLREHTTDVMAIHQYDIPRVGGGFDRRFWAPVNEPVCDEDGQLRWIVHRVDDVTAYVESRPDGLRFAQLAEQVRTSNARAEAEVFAHQRLHQEHQVLQALLDSLDAAVVGCGHDGRVVLANDAARDLLGPQITVPPTEWGPVLHLHHPDGRPIGPGELPLVRALHGERVLDLVMPGLNGLDVCRALRADPATADVPILMLSAYAMPADLQAGLDAGADDYMMKPFHSDELIARCTALIK